MTYPVDQSPACEPVPPQAGVTGLSINTTTGEVCVGPAGDFAAWAGPTIWANRARPMPPDLPDQPDGRIPEFRSRRSGSVVPGPAWSKGFDIGQFALVVQFAFALGWVLVWWLA